MAHALTRFGRMCRDIRGQRGMTIAAQAAVLDQDVSTISSIETGKIVPSLVYIDSFAEWLKLNDQQYLELKKRVPAKENVIEFPRRPGVTRSVKMFRKISRMTPTEIRGLKDERWKGVPYD